MNTGLNLAGAVAPVLTPLIKDAYGWSAAWLAAGAAATLAGLLWTLVQATTRQPVVTAEPQGSVG
jgi:dipeptide/tripeptide permease